MHLLLTRPRSEATADALRARGYSVGIAPLMAFEPVDWHADQPAAIMLTSPQGALAAPMTWQIPAFCVGGATAAAARSRGYTDIREGDGTVQMLVHRIADDGFARVLHLAGADRTAFALPSGLGIDTVIVYRARLLALESPPVADCVLLYSARTAAHFAAECDRLGVPRAAIAIAALSPAIAAAAGPGWRAVITAQQPHEAALLAAIDAACQKGAL